MRVSLGDYKKLKGEVAAAKRQAHGWHVMYKDAVVEIAELEASIKRKDAKINRLKLRD